MRQQRRGRRARATPLIRPVLALVDFLLAITVRYGREPLWAFAWLAVFVAIGWGVFRHADAVGALVPADGDAERSAAWTSCVPPASPGAPTQIACFLASGDRTAHAPFDAAVYSADVLLPIIDFGMESAWTPDDRRPFGTVTQVYIWMQTVVGWALSLLAVAGFSGLIKSG